MISKKIDQRRVEAQEEDCSIAELLKAAGALSPERGKEILDEVEQSREEWDS